jgi:hypothetical protein
MIAPCARCKFVTDVYEGRLCAGCAAQAEKANFEQRIKELELALRAVVEHSRPAFQNTPYRKALDNARKVLGHT